MNKKFICIILLLTGTLGCDEEKFISDDCPVNTYGCFDSGEKILFQCQLIDFDHSVTRWERVSDLEQKQICGSDGCTICRDKLNNDKKTCEAGKFQCIDKELNECKYKDNNSSQTYWSRSDIVCEEECDKCAKSLNINCKIGTFICQNEQLNECQAVDLLREIGAWKVSDICTMNCDSCLNALKEGCSHGEIQCDANHTFMCESSGLVGYMDIWNSTDECQDACSNCQDEGCISCLDKHNAGLEKCENDDEYFDYRIKECVVVDANHNHMHDQYENLEKNKTTCQKYSDCDSSEGAEDGFCDSSIGYKCSTKCTSDTQCIDDEKFHYVCRSDGRCAPDEFVTEWKVTKDNKSVTIYSEDCDIEQIDWGDGDITKKEITVCNDNNKPVRHVYASEATFTIRIKGKINEWSAHPYSSDFDTDVPPDKINLVSVVAFGPVGLGTHCFAGTTISSLSNVDIPNARLMKDLSYAFSYTNFGGPVEHWDVSKVRIIKGMFSHNSTFNQPLSNWDVSNVTNMAALFDAASSFNRSLDSWDTSRVTNMRRMFKRASSFDSSISKWDVSNVENMSEMFYAAESFDQDILKWKTDRVKSMSNMFEGAKSFNHDIKDWNTSSVTNMDGMFKNAKSFNKNINTNSDKTTWNVSNVTMLRAMFEGAESFDQPLNNWDTGSVTNMYRMFRDAVKFNQDISGWNTEKVQFMNEMFYGARTFNKDVSKWKTPNVIALQHMFENSGFSYNVKNWDVSSVKCDDKGTFYLMFSNSKITYEVCKEIASEWQKTNDYYKNVKPSNGKTALEKIIGNLGCPAK